MSYFRALAALVLLARVFGQDLSGDCSLGGGANCSLSLLQAAPAERRKGGQSLISSDANTSEASDEQLKLLFSKFNISERFDGRSGEHNPGRDTSLVVIVTHRELVIGCHNFEQFLSPDYHTWFVFEKKFAKAWGLDKKVKDPSVNGLPHLITTDVVTGEVHARAAVLSILQHEADMGTGPAELPEFMYSTMCDIQPLPKWHPYHTPFPEMVWEMVRVFSLEKATRAAGATTNVQDVASHRDGKFMSVNESCYNADPATRKQYPVLTVNNLIIETLPMADHVKGAQMHGRDVGQFVNQGGLDKAKPWKLPSDGTDAEHPWLSDVTTFVEDHSILYDVALYLTLQGDQSIADQLLRTGDTLYHNEVYIGELACRYDMTNIRHNNLFTFYDRAHPQEMSYPEGKSTGAMPVYDLGAYADVDTDFIKTYNLELLAERDSPISRLSQFMSAAENMKSTNDIDWGNSFAVMHFDRWWLPSKLFQPAPGSQGSIFELKSLLAPLFKISGYEPLSIADSIDGTMVLQRTSVPMARMLISAETSQSSPPEMLKAGETPKDAPKPSRCRYESCALFLDLWVPKSGERLAVWSSDGEKRIIGKRSARSVASPIVKGLLKDYHTLLKLPLHAELLYLGRPFGKNGRWIARVDELKLAAKRTCQLHFGKNVDDGDVFLPEAENRFLTAVHIRPGNAQGVPPQMGFDSCHLWK